MVMPSLPCQPCIQTLSPTSKVQLKSSSSLKPALSPAAILITFASLWNLPSTEHDVGQECGLLPPHFTAGEMRIEEIEKLITQPVLPWVRDISYFYSPT